MTAFKKRGEQERDSLEGRDWGNGGGGGGGERGYKGIFCSFENLTVRF